MIFKTLVECLLKQISDPDDCVALNALHTLTREIKNDLTEAFLMSEPLVKRHTRLFWESRSYLDFLIKISHLPSDNDFYTCLKPLGPKEKCEDYLDDSLRTLLKDERKKLKDCLEEKEILQKKLQQYNTEEKTREGKNSQLKIQLQECENALKKCQEEQKTLQNRLEMSEQKNNSNDVAVFNDTRKNELEMQLIKYKEQLQNITNQVHKAYTQNEKLNTEMNALIEVNENLKLLIQRRDNEAYWYEQQQELLQKIGELSNMLKKQLQTFSEGNQILLQQCNEYDISMNDSDSKSDDSLSLTNRTQKTLTWTDNGEKYLQNALEQKEQNLKDCINQNNLLEEKLKGYINQNNLLEEKLKDCEFEKSQLKGKLKDCESEMDLHEDSLQDYEKQESPQKDTSEHIELQLFKSQSDSQIYKKKNINFNENEYKTDVQKILKFLATRYPSRDWDEILINLSNNLSTYDIFQKQLVRLENETHWIKVQPHLFADTVLEIHKQIPDKVKMLNAIADVAELPVNEELVSEISERLHKYNTINEIYQYFNTEFNTWAKRIRYNIEKLKDIVMQNYKIESEDWLDKGILHIEKSMHTFKGCEKIINELMQLTPDIKCNESFNMCDWKNELIKRYTLLKDYAKSLSGSLENLSNRMNMLQSNAGNTANTPDWLWHYVQIMQNRINDSSDLKAKSTHIKKPYQTNILKKECEKLANYFKIVLQKDSFFNDILTSDLLKKYIDTYNAYSYFKQELNSYFIPSLDLNRESIISYVETIFQKLLTQHEIPIQMFNQAQSTFETHVQFHLSKAILYSSKKVETEWKNLYEQWLKQLNLQPDICRDNLISEIKKQQNDEWICLYKQWLTELNVNLCTPKENFLKILKTYKTREKRSAQSETFELSCEKKIKLHDNWTETQIQNLFLALYREFFTLKWNYLQKILPTNTELITKLKQKLQYLEQLTSTPRQNMIVIICLSYIKLDLAALTEKEEVFTNITNIDNMLKMSMKHTEEYLSNLMYKHENSN